MPLKKQNAVVPFIGGLETKQNEFLVQPPNLLELDNGVFKSEGKIEKRKGFTKLSSKDFNQNNIIGKKLLTYNNDLVQLSQTNLYSYIESSDVWFDKGAFASVTAVKNSVIRNRYSQTNQVHATNNNISVIAWEDSRGSNLYKYSILDESSQTIIKADVVLSNTGTCNWAVCSKFLSSFLVILYSEGTTLKAKIIDTISFQEYNQTVAGIATGNYGAASVVESGTNLVIAYNNSSTFVEISSLSLDSTTTTPFLLDNGAGGQLSPTLTATACHLFTKVAQNQVFLVYSTGTTLRLQASFSTLIINNAHNVQITTTAATFPRVSGIDANNASEIIIVWEESAASAKNHKLYSAHYTYSSNNAPVQTIAPAIIKRSVGLAGNCLRIGDTIYIVSAHESSLQASIFLLQYKTQANVPIAGKLLTSIAGGQPASGVLPSFQTDESGQYLITLLEITKLETSTGTVTDNTGVVKLKLDFSNPPFVAAQLGESLLIAGGFVSAYDGSAVVEHGFHLFPEDVTIGHSNPGGAIDAGTYNCRVIYEWSDGKGQIHRSAPSITTSTSPGSNSSIISVTTPSLRLSAKQDVSIVVYLTEDAGTVYYRAATVSNNPSVDSQTINITSIAGLSSQEILYTTGGVVENIAPPAASIVHRHKNRIFLAGLENSNEVRFSQESVVNEGLSFSDFYRILVNPAGGPITALGTLDDKLIIFKEDSVYALAGNGPVLTGQNNDYTQPEEISTDTGCDNPASIIITPVGLMFSSVKGIRLLNRSLQIEDIGAPVEKYEEFSVSSAVLVPNADEVRFTTMTGPALIYNYAFKLWTAFTNYSSFSSTSWKSQYVHLDVSGISQLESSSFNDNGRAIPLHLRTSWIALAGIQGYKRVYRILVLGNRLSEHAFRVNIRYDYDDNIRETIYFNTLTNMNQETVPQNTQWIGVDSNSISGVKSEVFQFEMQPKIQKCESIQLEIEDIPLQGEIGAGFTLAGLTFLVGIIDGTAQVTNTIGSK